MNEIITTEHLWIGGYRKVSIYFQQYKTYEYPSNEFKVVLRPFYKVGWDYLGKRKYRIFTTLKSLIKHLRKLGANNDKILEKIINISLAVSK